MLHFEELWRLRKLVLVVAFLSGILYGTASAETDALLNAAEAEAGRFDAAALSRRETPGGDVTSARRAVRPEWPRAISEALFPDKPLTSGIKKTSSPRRVFALRLAERGREYLIHRQYTKALSHLEMALGLESVPHFYYYLAQTHYLLEQFDSSSKFLEVAETLLSSEPRWLMEVRELRRKLVSQAELANRIR